MVETSSGYGGGKFRVWYGGGKFWLWWRQVPGMVEASSGHGGGKFWVIWWRQVLGMVIRGKFWVRVGTLSAVTYVSPL